MYNIIYIEMYIYIYRYNRVYIYIYTGKSSTKRALSSKPTFDYQRIALDSVYGLEYHGFMALSSHDWLVVDLPLRKMMEFVSWGDEIPNWMESHKIPWLQTTNQMNKSIKEAWK